MTMAHERWAVFIDIQGFGALWSDKNRGLFALRDLMTGIYRIAKRCYPDPPHRFFAYQLGDGFIISSDFGFESLAVPVAISVALLRHVAAGCGFAKVAIAEGDMADIQGCYPREVLDGRTASTTVSMGAGLMTLFPVMGTGLIRAYGLMSHAPTGPLLVMSRNCRARVPQPDAFSDIPKSELMTLDWLHVDDPLASEIQQKAALNQADTTILEAKVRDYCRNTTVPKSWRTNAMRFLKVGRDVSGHKQRVQR
jgi:hypothetical protein